MTENNSENEFQEPQALEEETSEEEQFLLHWLSVEARAQPGKVRIASLEDLKPKLIIRK